MDLSRLVNNDAPSAQTTSSIAALGTQQYAQQHAGQPQTPYTSAEQRQPSHGQLSRQSSFGSHPSRPFESAGAQSHSLNLSTGVAPYPSHPSASVSPYSAYQASPYSAQSGPAGRPTNNEKYPATPLQLHPPQNAYQPTLSPSASSQHSQTPQSARHSPMPTLQYGLNPQASGSYHASQPGVALAAPSFPRGPYSDTGSSPQQPRQPLGPPPLPMNAESPVSRRSSEHQAGPRSRAQSASISPRTLPPQPHFSREMSQNGTSHPSVNGQHSVNPYHSPLTINYQSSSASPAPLNTSTAPERPPIRRSHTMEMSHLLTPSTEIPPPPSQSDRTQPPVVPQALEHQSKKRAFHDDDDAATAVAELERPVKRERKRQYLERPPWAQYSAKNPIKTGIPIPVVSRQNGIQSRPAATPANGVQHASSLTTINHSSPWLNPLPYDMDLIHAREVLGPWEKSIRWNTPYPDILRGVQDWLMQNLNQHQDILGVPELATIEIEAKIGRLIRTDTGVKASLPILNMAVLNPSFNRDHRFESALELDDFQNVNGFLNDCLVKSKQPGRQAMLHKRTKEVDSFLDLSPAGVAMLPDSLKRKQQHGRTLSLRTTTNEAGAVTARIVKVSISDLHIINPSGYDCRISMNAEVNYLRESVAPESITFEPTSKSAAQPSRRKDRISYKHLAYSMDLTAVNVSGMPPKYEIEVEVDAQVLSTQVRLMLDSRPHAFSDVVSGFLDNTTFLMRAQPATVPRGR